MTNNTQTMIVEEAAATTTKPPSRAISKTNFIALIVILVILASLRASWISLQILSPPNEKVEAVGQWSPILSTSTTPMEINNLMSWQFSKHKTQHENGDAKTPNFIVLLTCSDGFYDMWVNWLTFFEKLQIPNLPVHLFAEDISTYNHCTRQLDEMKKTKADSTRYVANLTCVSWETVFSQPAKEKIGALGYRKHGYIKMMSHRPQIISSELEKGYDVIFSDVDAIWKKSPLPYFENEFYSSTLSNDHGHYIDTTDTGSEVQIWAQQDPPRSFTRKGPTRDNLCPGFMVFKSCLQTIAFVDKWGELISQEGNEMRNQEEFNRMIWEYNITTKITPKALASNLFVTGRTYFTNMTDDERSDVVIAHNNGISGYENKVNRFKEFGLWILDFNETKQ